MLTHRKGAKGALGPRTLVVSGKKKKDLGVAGGLVKEEFYMMFSYLTRKVNSYDLQEEPTWEMEQPEF